MRPEPSPAWLATAGWVSPRTARTRPTAGQATAARAGARLPTGNAAASAASASGKRTDGRGTAAPSCPAVDRAPAPASRASSDRQARRPICLASLGLGSGSRRRLVAWAPREDVGVELAERSVRTAVVREDTQLDVASLGRLEEEPLRVQALIERPAADRAPGAVGRGGRDLDLELAGEGLGRLVRLLSQDHLLDPRRLG